jgi:choline dehydrogenase-like flavoprotein
MLIDSRTLPQDIHIETDLCIVGAGAAGISIARELAGAGMKIALLESGGFNPEELTQSLYQGDNTGEFPRYAPDQPRSRYFGGTTNVWSGNCRPLEPSDFKQRAWIPHSGWPFGREELDPYYIRARQICQLGEHHSKPDNCKLPRDNSILPLAPERVRTAIFEVSPPTRFGRKYRDTVTSAANISVYLHANVVNIDANDTISRVRQLQVACLEGPSFRVSAKVYVLATGGIENPRLLLNSDDRQPAGLGNHHDIVGRFFMEHPSYYNGELILSDPLIATGLYRPPQPRDRQRVHGTLVLTESTQRQEQLAGFSLIPYSPIELPGVAESRYLLDAYAAGESTDCLLHYLKQTLVNIDNVADASYEKMLTDKAAQISYSTRTEQVPEQQSRVILSAERDALGKRRVNLHGKISPIDIRTIRRGLQIVGEELGKSGIGRLKTMIEDDDSTVISQLEGNHHHMGTTRMHGDPKQGVVNADCRVHGISNLYIAGSSVFPTSGYANPTLTIVALALRLADHIQKVMHT